VAEERQGCADVEVVVVRAVVHAVDSVVEVVIGEEGAEEEADLEAAEVEIEAAGEAAEGSEVGPGVEVVVVDGVQEVVVGGLEGHRAVSSLCIKIHTLLTFPSPHFASEKRSKKTMIH